MSAFVNTSPTARKRHACSLCDEGIRPGEKYRRGVGFDGGTAWTWKECLWCERAANVYCRTSESEYDSICIIEWLDDEHPNVYAQMRADWSYPDGERLPLPFQPRCIMCSELLDGWRSWCPPCDEQIHERTAR